MMESLRESAKGPVIRGILYLVILAFIFSGGSMVFNSVVGDNVASVNGEGIERAEFENYFQNRKRQYGEIFDKLFDTDEKILSFKQNLLNQYISQKLEQQAVENLGLRISNQVVSKEIKKYPYFQKDGVYDQELAEDLLRQNGWTKERFANEEKKRLARQQLVLGIVNSAFTLDGEIKYNYEMKNQERDFRYLNLAYKNFMEGVEVTDEAIAAYYDENQTQFQNPEKIKVDYVSLNIEDIEKNTTASEEELRQYYEENRANYKKESKRKAAHILIEFGEDEAAAEKKIKEIQAQLTAGGEFGDLAKKFSDDKVSAENYGELDWFGRDEMDKAFEDAVFALEKVGDVTDIVKTEFGYHIIKLSGVEAEGFATFADVKEDITTTVTRRLAEDKFLELKTIFDDKVLEVIGSVDEIANSIEGKVVSSPFFSRQTASGIFANPQVLNAAFSEDVLGDLNSEAIMIDDWHYMVLRKNSYEPSSIKPLELVKADIEQILKKELAIEKAQEKGNELLAKLRAGESIDEDIKALNFEWKEEKAIKRDDSKVDANIKSAAFDIVALGPEETKRYGSTDLKGDFAIIELNAVRNGDFSKAESAAKKQIKERIARATGEIDYRLFVESMRDKSDISVSL